MKAVLGRTAIQKTGSVAFLFSAFYLVVWSSQQYDFAWGMQRALEAMIPGSYESKVASTSIVAMGRLGALGLFLRIFGQQIYLWISGRKKANEFVLHFNSDVEAFQYAVEFMASNISEGQVVPGLMKYDDNTDYAGPIALVSISEGGVARDILAALPVDAHFDHNNHLCAVMIGPKPTLSGSDHSAVVIATLLPRLTEKGWDIKERFRNS